MLNSLRSRLLLSYLAVAGTALLIISLALLVVSVSETNRILPTLRELNVIALATRREIARMALQEAPLRTIEAGLAEVAEVQQVRILLAEGDGQRILFDTGQDWVGRRLPAIRRPANLFPNVDESLPIGRYRTPDDGQWLVYAQPLTTDSSSRLILVFARQEPTVLGFFRSTFLRPLIFAGLVALGLSLILAIWISRSVAGPLQDMAGASERIAQGDYEQRLPLRGPEEVQRLAGSFNSMSAQVAATRKAQHDFVANVSHDLKTPLTSIRGWSQALLDGTATEPQRAAQAAGIIHTEAERMQRLVDQLLDLAQIESGQLILARQPVDLVELLGDLHQNLAIQAREKGVELATDLAEAPPVLGDRDRLVQVFANLVENAIAHTPGGGRVLIRLRPYGQEQVAATIADSGPGIPAADLERIFERFYQVDKARVRTGQQAGAGLGLAIARELVEAHGGQVTVDSRTGQGSTFTVYLPAARLNDLPGDQRRSGGPGTR